MLAGQAVQLQGAEVNAPRDLSEAREELRVAELQADAAMRGESIAQAGIRRARDAMQRARPNLPGEAWRKLTPDVRQLLIAMATDRRDAQAAAQLPWAQLSDDERLCVGALAREWRRQLDLSGWLR